MSIKPVISIPYAGLMLPVYQNEANQDVTPFKPIATGVFGLDWKTQYNKVTQSPFLMREFGLATPLKGYGSGEKDPKTSEAVGLKPHSYDQKDPKTDEAIGLNPYGFAKNQVPLCIKLDRVVHYMMTINPDRVRANGNISSADFLEAKIGEWADVLHGYETMIGDMSKSSQPSAHLELKRINAFVNISKQKSKTEEPAERRAFQAMQGKLAEQTGVVYQPDLLDS